MITCFISYRRGRPWQARSVHTELERRNYKSIIDVDNIEVGTRFPQVIEHNIKLSDVIFVVIDKEWLVEKDGQRRLNNPEDWVRREIELALNYEKSIVPLLVDGASMPQKEDLPESLGVLPEYQGARLRAEEFQTDFARILATLERCIEEQRAAIEILEKVKVHWEKGNWRQIHKHLSEASNNWGNRGGRILPDQIRKRLAISSQLMQAAEAFSQRKFEAAVDVLEQVPIADAPRNVACSIKLAKLGRRTLAASKIERLDALKAAAEEYALVKNETIVDQLEIVPGLDEVGKVISDAQTEIEYQEALAVFRAGRFSEASVLLAQLGDYRDAPKLLAACAEWAGFFECIRKREWEKAKSVLAGLERLGDAATAQRWRRWCNVMRRSIDALDVLGREATLLDPDVAWEGGKCPYAVLGLAPTADSQTIKDLLHDLMDKPGGVQPEERKAWDSLRLSEERLVADFRGYRVSDPKRARRLAQELVSPAADTSPNDLIAPAGESRPGTGPGPDDKSSRSHVRLIAERLDEDAALFFRLLNMHEAAFQDLEERFKRAPDKKRLLHHLGLTAASRLRAESDNYAELSDIWERLILAWGALFADDEFWHHWWRDRDYWKEVNWSQVLEARHRIQRYWLDESKSASEPGRDYNLLFQIEINGARAVAAGVSQRGEKRPILGPMGAKAFELQADLAAWVATFELDSFLRESWQKRVCLYFSELAEVATLADLGRHQDVLTALAALKPRARGEFETRNPGFARLPNRELRFRRALNEFAEQARHKLAIDLISQSPPCVQEAIESWQAALAVAEKLGRNADLLLELQKVVVARANQMRAEESTDRLERFDSAIALLEALRDADMDDGHITSALVETLLDRAVFMGNEYSDNRAARFDAIKAYNMAKTSRGLVTLYAATISLARDEKLADHSDLTRVLLRQASRLYAEEEDLRIPVQRTLEEWKQKADELQAMLDSDRANARDAAIENLKITLGALPASSDSSAQSSDPYAEALIKQSKKEFEGAIEIYKELLTQSLNDPQIAAKLANCYRQWWYHLKEHDAPQARIKEIVRQALESCPNSEFLRDLQESGDVS
jgi:hypothetical protein